jgi:hypothetical protein
MAYNQSMLFIVVHQLQWPILNIEKNTHTMKVSGGPTAHTSKITYIHGPLAKSHIHLVGPCPSHTCFIARSSSPAHAWKLCPIGNQCDNTRSLKTLISFDIWTKSPLSCIYVSVACLLRAALHLEAGPIRCVRGLKSALVIGQKFQIGPNPFTPRGRADVVV